MSDDECYAWCSDYEVRSNAGFKNLLVLFLAAADQNCSA
jgi:hypothetical protein